MSRGWHILRDGGSLTLLAGAESAAKRALVREVESAKDGFQSIPVYLSRTGLRLWESS